MAAEAHKITETNRSQFEFIEVIEKPIVVPVACFLTGSKGEDIFNEARDRAVNKYNSARVLMSPVYIEGVAQGSTHHFVVLINEVLGEDSSRKLWTATPADIEKTLRAEDALGIKGNFYVDTALVLRSEQDSYKPNDPLSRDLYAQVKKRQGRKLKLPVMIPLCGLDLKVDDSSQYGLGFNLREDAEIVYAPILDQPGRFNPEDINSAIGLPTKTGKEGSRDLYTRKEGLSRLSLSSGLNLHANWSNLYDSDGSGRVAVCGEAARENLEKL